MTTKEPALRFVPRVPFAVVHLLLIAAVFALFMGRKHDALRPQLLLDVDPDVFSHISNFALSYILYAGVGFMWLMMGVSMRTLAWAGLALVGANVGYELLLPVLNTRDPIDAIYGLAGTLVAFAWLWCIQRRGLRAQFASSRASTASSERE